MESRRLPIFVRSVGQIAEEMILDLIHRKVSESRFLDYKREAYGLTDSEKFKLLKHICGFANASGGVIVFGVEEENEIPVNIQISKNDQVALKVPKLSKK